MTLPLNLSLEAVGMIDDQSSGYGNPWARYDGSRILVSTEEAYIWVFEEHPHSLSSVHCRTNKQERWLHLVGNLQSVQNLINGISRWGLAQHFRKHLLLTCGGCSTMFNQVYITKLETIPGSQPTSRAQLQCDASKLLNLLSKKIFAGRETIACYCDALTMF